MLTSTCAHYPIANGTASFEVGARCMTKPMPEPSCEMSIVAKAAGTGNLAKRLSLAWTTIQEVCGVIQTTRIDELSARKSALGKKLVDIAH